MLYIHTQVMLPKLSLVDVVCPFENKSQQMSRKQTWRHNAKPDDKKKQEND